MDKFKAADILAIRFAIFTVAFIVTVGLISWLWPTFYEWLSPSTPSERIEFIAAITQLMSGLALLGGLLFTFQTVRNSVSSLDHQRKSERNERFFSAIEQLGNSNVDIRVGAAHALGQLASESETHYNQCRAVLLHFIRRKTQPAEQAEDEDLIQGDVQAAIDVLCHGARPSNNVKSIPLDFSGLRLNGANFSQGNLANSDFCGSSLVSANFIGALLCDARFQLADCTACQFQNAELQNAKFNAAGLERARFSSTIDSTSVNERLEGGYVDFDEVEQLEMELPEWTNASKVRSERGIRLKGTNFFGAGLDHTYFSGVDLSESVDLYHEQLAASVTDKHTILPRNLPTFEQWKLGNAGREVRAKSQRQ